MRVSVVVFASGLPVTVIVELPTGVVALVAMVRVLVQVGEHGLFVNVAVAPIGRPEAARLTGCVVPLTSVAVIVELPLLPWTTLRFPLFARL